MADVRRKTIKMRYWLVRTTIEKYTIRPLVCLFRGHQKSFSERNNIPLESWDRYPCYRCGHGYGHLWEELKCLLTTRIDPD